MALRFAEPAVKNAQLVWLRDALAKSQARWKAVFLHHSIYSAATKFNGHGRQQSVLRLRALLEPIFVGGGVDLVLAGHDHHYDRSTLQPAKSPTGHQVQYVTAGASARLRTNVVDHTNTFLAKADATTHSFLIESYLLDDLTTDVNAGFVPARFLRLGVTGGFMDVYTGPGKRGGVPSIEERFDATTAPGLGDDPAFARWGIFAYFDHRNAHAGPRSGGLYGARFRQFADLGLEKYSFRQAEFEAQHYLPYFNKTRVIALRAATVLSFPKSGQVVPYYLQPTIGGNNDVRGFPRYRYHDNHSVFFSAEHRWHGFTNLDTAFFIDAGKVIARKADVDLSDLKVSVGVGFRVRVADAVVMRIDAAAGREGFRTMWTFSDIYKVRW